MAMQVLDLAPNPAIEEKYLFASKVLPLKGNILFHSYYNLMVGRLAHTSWR